MTRHFCCCIPVRVAVFVSSLLTLLISLVVAAGSGYVLIKNDQHDPSYALPSTERTVFIVVAIVYSIVALVSMFGFIGAIIRKRSFVALYSVMTIIAFLLQSAVDGFTLYSVFRGKSNAECTTVDQKTGDSNPDLCLHILRGSRIAVTVVLSLIWLLQLYLVIVIRRYVKQLDEDQFYRTSGSAAFSMAPTGQATYYQHSPLPGGQAPPGHYPYSDPQHSFGPPA